MLFCDMGGLFQGEGIMTFTPSTRRLLGGVAVRFSDRAAWPVRPRRPQGAKTVRARRFDERFTGHGERLHLVRAYGKGGYDDEYWDDEDEDGPAWVSAQLQTFNPTDASNARP